MIAIAGVGGGLGPVVAERLAAEGAIVAGTDRSKETLDSLAADLDLPAERWDGRAVDLLDEDATAPGAAPWSSALAVSTASFTSSVAGVGESRCTRRRSRTGRSSMTC